MQRLLPLFLTLGLAQAQQAPVALAPVQIILDDVTFRGSKFKIGQADLLKPLVDMFQQAGFTVLPAKGTIPPDALQLRFMVGAVHDGSSRVAFQVSCRASAGKDAELKENPTGQPQRIWFANITAARSGFEDGIAEIHATLANIATIMYRKSAQAQGKETSNVVFPVTFPAPPPSARINPAEVQNLSGLKVKAEGFRPPWPKQALERRISGTVVVELIVGEDGRPLRATIKQGPPELYLHAIQWAMGYEFEPAAVDGKAVKAKFIFNLGYRQNDLEHYSIR